LVRESRIVQGEYFPLMGWLDKPLTKRQSGVQLVANLNFPRVVPQHTVGVMVYLIRVLFAIYSSFEW